MTSLADMIHPTLADGFGGGDHLRIQKAAHPMPVIDQRQRRGHPIAQATDDKRAARREVAAERLVDGDRDVALNRLQPLLAFLPMRGTDLSRPCV